MSTALLLLFLGLSAGPNTPLAQCTCDHSDLVTTLYGDTNPTEHAALQTALCQASGYADCRCRCDAQTHTLHDRARRATQDLLAAKPAHDRCSAGDSLPAETAPRLR